MRTDIYVSPLAYIAETARIAASVDLAAVQELRDRIAKLVVDDYTLFVVGNGGFGTVAEHFALGMSLNVLREGGHSCRAYALSPSGPITTSAINDFGYDDMFAAQVRALGRPNDMLLALSGSGMSENIARAQSAAIRQHMFVASISGRGGPIAQLSRLPIVLNTDSNAIAEDAAIMLLHWVYGTFMAEAQS